MSVMSLGRVVRPHGAAARALLLGGTAVVAVLIGLLGMHVFSTGGAHHAAVVSQPLDGAVVAPGDAEDAAHDVERYAAHDASGAPCDGDACDGALDPMSLMVCVLALLVSVLVVSVRPAWVARPPRRAPASSSATSSPAEPIPPDRIVLCVSRT